MSLISWWNKQVKVASFFLIAYEAINSMICGDHSIQISKYETKIFIVLNEQFKV